MAARNEEIIYTHYNLRSEWWIQCFPTRSLATAWTSPTLVPPAFDSFSCLNTGDGWLINCLLGLLPLPFNLSCNNRPPTRQHSYMHLSNTSCSLENTWNEMTLDYILWLTVHKDSSAHKCKKKKGFLIQKRVEHFFPHSNHSAPGRHQQNTCPHVVSTHLPPSKDPLAFVAQIIPRPMKRTDD